MLDSIERRLILGCCAAVLLVAGFLGYQGHKEQRVTAGMAIADTKHEVAAVATGKAEVYDAQLKAKEPEVQDAKVRVAVAQKRLADLPETPTLPVPLVPGSDPAAVDPELVALRTKIDAQRDVISSQGAYIGQLEGKVATLTLAEASWRSSAQASAQESVQLRAVITAQKGLIEGALWKGRIQGFLVGAAGGYAGGRWK